MRAWAEVNLDALAHNVREIKACIKDGVKFMAVVKADAYGHGVAEVAAEVLENGADYLAVAFCDEAVELRKKGFDVPILILGNVLDVEAETIVDYDITATVSDVSFARALSKVAMAKKPLTK